MDIVIHIFTDSNPNSKIVYFVYKKDGYACASLQWSRFIPEKYRLFNYTNKVCDKLICETKIIPWSKIEDIIKETIKRQSNIDVSHIEFFGKSKINRLFQSKNF